MPTPRKDPDICPVPGCRYTSPKQSKVFEHLRHCHSKSEIPAEYVARHGLAPCEYCGQLLKSITRHYPQCSLYLSNRESEVEERPISPLREHEAVASSSRSMDDSTLSGSQIAMMNGHVDSTLPTGASQPAPGSNCLSRPASISISHVPSHVPSSASPCQPLDAISLARLASNRRHLVIATPGESLSLNDDTSSRLAPVSSQSRRRRSPHRTRLVLSRTSRIQSELCRGQSAHRNSHVSSQLRRGRSPRDAGNADRLEGYAFLPTLEFEDLSAVISPSIENIPSNLQGIYLPCCRLVFENIIADPTNVDPWKLLYLLPRLILQPLQAEGSDEFDLDRKARIRLFLEKKWGILFDSSHLAELSSSPDRDISDEEASSGVTSSSLNAAVEKKVRHGEISCAGHLLTSNGLASPSDETFHKLERKHPPSSPPTIPRGPEDVTPLQASFQTLRQVLRDSPRGSGGGCDSWRFEHLRLLLEDHKVLLSFLTVCNLFLAGAIPVDAATVVAGARLIALSKGQSDVRPIAVGNVFRRTAAKLACSLLRDRFGSYFSPFQFGVSTPDGSERVVHLLQLSLSQHPDWVLLKTDARYAFNSISRQRFLDLVTADFSTLQAFVAACYAVPPSLVLLHVDGFRWIRSEEGVQQEDPLGPFLFSLALQSCLVEAQAAVGSGFVISYLDDAIIAGPVDSVVSSFKVLRQCMQEVGLIVRPDKCEALSLQADASWPLQDIAFTTSGMSVLGCSIGSNAYVAEECERIVTKEKVFLERLCGLRNMQSALLLLRYCGTGQINHLLRAIPPSIIQPAVQQHDSNFHSCFCSIIGCQLDDTRIHQLHLRLSQGGLGLPLAERTSPCAFLGARAATLASLPQRLQQFPSPLAIFVNPSNKLYCGHVFQTFSGLVQSLPAILKLLPSIDSLPDKHVKLQRTLSRLIVDAAHNFLLQAFDRPCQARVRSAAGPDAGAWLDAIPASRHLSFTNAEFQTAVSLRLGLPIPVLRRLPRCTCSTDWDSEGYHALTCGKDGGQTRRHDKIQHTWLALLCSINLHCEREREGEFSDFKRPDISVYDYHDGKKLLLDVSIINPQRPGCLPQNHFTNGAAAVQRGNEKRIKYQGEATSLGYLFEPLTFEVFGCWSSVAVEFFKKIVRRPSLEFLDDRPAASRYWRRNLAVCLQWMNSQIILRKVASLVPGSALSNRLGPHDTYIRFFTR